MTNTSVGEPAHPGTDAETCPLCENAVLKQFTGDHAFFYRDAQHNIPDFQWSECPSCGSEVLLFAQLKHNEARIAEIKASIDKDTQQGETA